MGLFGSLFGKKKEKEWHYTEEECGEVIVNGVIDARDGHHVDYDHLPLSVDRVRLPNGSCMARYAQSSTGWIVEDDMEDLWDKIANGGN